MSVCRVPLSAALLSLLFLLTPCIALAGEEDPLLSVDDLRTLEESYDAFLSELETLCVDRGLITEDERSAWHNAMMGDFYQNGGYGSILANYTPGILHFMREEDTLLTLRAQTETLSLELLTMRRYTPQDSSLPGLILTPTVSDHFGAPIDAAFELSATSGIFLKWDALMGAYISVGTSAKSDGDTIVWSDQTPAANANAPMLTLRITDTETNAPLAEAELILRVDGNSYCADDHALTLRAAESMPQTQAPNTESE